MNLTYTQKAWASVFAIIAMFGICVYLITADIVSAVVLVVPAFASYPLGQYVWAVLRYERANTVRILNNSLAKAGFNVDNTEWNEEHTAVRYFGKFRGDSFMIEAAPGCAYVNIYDMPWHQMKSNDPNIHQLMEAVNDTNAASSNMSVVVCDPSEEGNRDIYTRSRTILPDYKTEEYLDSLMCEMLNQKKALLDNMNRPRPWVTAKKSGPIGFTVPTASDVKG